MKKKTVRIQAKPKKDTPISTRIEKKNKTKLHTLAKKAGVPVSEYLNQTIAQL